MPLHDHRVAQPRRRFKVNDNVVLKLPKFVKDADDTTIYPQEVLKAFIKYFNNLYQAKIVHADRFIVDKKPGELDPGKSHLDLFVYVPGDLTREDFLDDLEDFVADFPGVRAEIIKRWPKANQWNEEHKEEIAAGKAKPRKEGIQMAKNAASAYPKRTLETLMNYLMEEAPVHPYPNATPEELEELERKKDPKLMEFYKAEDEFDAHQGETRDLLNVFEEEYGHKFDKNDPDDVEDIKYIYNDLYEEKLQEKREWYPADVRLSFNVGEFAPGKEGNIDLLSLYDRKPEKKEIKKDSKPEEKQKEVKDEAPIGEQLAKLFAKEFKGHCGPFGGENPELKGNKLGLHSQMPTEWFVFNDDGSVDFENIEELIDKDPDNWSVETGEDKEYLLENNSHFNSIRDLLYSDLMWFMDLDVEKILKEVDQIIKPKVEDTEDDLADRITNVLDDYGILYGDIVDYDDKVNIVGVDEEEWQEVVDCINDELGLDVIVPDEDHEEFDDELIVMK